MHLGLYPGGEALENLTDWWASRPNKDLNNRLTLEGFLTWYREEVHNDDDGQDF